MTTRRQDELEDTRLDPGSEDTFDALLKKVAHISGPVVAGLGLRLRPGDTLRDGRLRIRRRLGEGGMGVVYEAYDEERRGPVALKTLSRLDPENIYRLKREFRSLAGVSHPNLCQLHELFSEGGDWFFTMRLLQAQSFSEWVRPRGGLDGARLLSVMADIFHGVQALHEADKLHRDLKPSNVLITEDGRAVILDFGLVADHEAGGAGQTHSEGIVTGTPAYMAPEQAAGATATAASDFYALGVMLFEALGGRLPFEGSVHEILFNKQTRDPPALDTSALPQLAALCMRMLARDPAQRPSDAELRLQLAPGPDPARTSGLGRAPVVRSERAQDSARPAPALLGRDAELARLRRACAAMLAEQPTVMLVSGASGMGKSALVQAFLADVERRDDTVVLAGRCYERENVPFKGFDALVDDLSRYLRRLPREDVAAILPREVFALARVFPVLARVPIVAEAPVRLTQDPQDLRRRAFAAFGDLVARLRDRRPLCIFIDDLQWLDADSVLFLRALLVDRDPSPVLLILSYRSEGAAEDEQLTSLIELAEANRSLHVERLALEPVNELAAAELALQNLPAELAGRGELAEGIARESGGSPFFVAELARHAARLGGTVRGLSLPAVLEASLASLSEPARNLLELSALSGQPLPVEVLLAGASSDHEALDELRGRQLVRSSHATRGKMLECYHDRVREYVSAQLDASARAQRYGALAAALLQLEPNASPELLTTCFEGCGQPLQASHFAALAAARAEQGMAFDRAAVLYRKALDLGAPGAPDRRAHQVALAEALANAGRAKQAADAFLAASALTHGAPALDLRQRAADELLGSGYATEGEALLREVLTRIGIELPRSQAAALLGFGLSQAKIRLLGLANAERPARALKDVERRRLEMLQSASRLAVVDPVLGAWCCDQYLLAALDARDPSHLARALSIQAYQVTVFTPKAEARIKQIYALAERCAARAGVPAITGTVAMWEGAGVIFGREMSVARCRELLLRAEELLRGGRGVRHEVDITNVYQMWVLANDLTREARRTAALVEEAFALGRIWSASIIAAGSAISRLAVGDVSGVARDLELADAIWKPQQRADMQWIDVCMLIGFADLANYRGDPAHTLQVLERAWSWFAKSPVRRGAVALAVMHGFRGTAALSLFRREGKARPALRELAAADEKALAKLGATAYPFLLAALRCGRALAHGRRGEATQVLREYIASPPVSPLLGTLDVHVARRRLGQLLGDDEGARLIAAGDAGMREMGVVDLEPTCEMVLPGCAPAYT